MLNLVAPLLSYLETKLLDLEDTLKRKKWRTATKQPNSARLQESHYEEQEEDFLSFNIHFITHNELSTTKQQH